jgi:Family of unknown function (DUF6058)
VELSERDVAYVREGYAPLEEVCTGAVRRWIAAGFVPRASYVLPDGTEMYPRDLLSLVEAVAVLGVRAEFERRYDAAEPVEEQWDAYLTGLYAVCLREVTPETIARKSTLVDELTVMLEEPKPGDAAWLEALRDRVDELDGLEREFSPDHDRVAFGRPPTRDTLIAEPRRRFLRGQNREAVA